MAQPFVIDKRGAFAVIFLGVVLLPGLCFLSVASLVNSLQQGESWALAIPAVGLVLLGIYFLWATLRELRGAWGIRIDDDGIHSGKFPGGCLSWDQVQLVEPLSFGVWRVHGPSSKLRICAYLFESREKLSRLVKKRAPSSQQG